MATSHGPRYGLKIINRLTAWDSPQSSRHDSNSKPSHNHERQWFNSEYVLAGPRTSRARLRAEMERELLNTERTARQTRTRQFHLAMAGACGHDSHQTWARKEQLRLVAARKHRLSNRLSATGAGNRGSRLSTQSRGTSLVNHT